MASHHHHHHVPPPYCCCSSPCSPCSSCSPSPDPLLHALASHLLLPQSQHHLHLHRPSPPPPPPHLLRADPKPTLLHSLLRRVSALESSLASPNPSPPPPPPISASLRHSAARVIQRRFRLFLVRRSQALRALRRIAAVRSRLAALVASLGARDPKSLCREASDLLHQLDSVQSGDPMVCDGKRSVSVELAGIVEALERIPAARRRQVAEERLENVDGSSRTSSAEEEEVDSGNVGSARLGLYAPLPVKMEPRRRE